MKLFATKTGAFKRLSSRTTASPLRLGMSISRIATSGDMDTICCSDSSPFAASATTSKPGSTVRAIRSPYGSNGQSSATRMVIGAFS